MATFKMRNRPKKPTAPHGLSESIGDLILFSELQNKVDKFREHNQLASTAEVEIVVGDHWNGGYCISLEAEGKTHAAYNLEMVVFKAKLKEYNNWRKDNRIEIEKYKAKLKKEINIRNLERRLAKATKDAEDIKVKLECSK